MAVYGRAVFSRREVVASFVGLLAVCVGLYAALWSLDYGVHEPDMGPLRLLAQPGAAQTLANLGEVTVAILGVALTVVTIIVELASTRYTPRITELFIRDPVNAVVMGFFVCTSVLVLWVDMSLYGEHHPERMVAAATGAMSVALLVLLPYFAYVFDFLLPTRVVDAIQQRSAHAIRRVTRQGGPAIAAARTEVRNGIEQLGDIALNSVDKKDKGISIAALEALHELAAANLHEKGRLPEAWFDSEALVERDQDFISMHPESIRALTRRRTWVEMKIHRQYQAVFEEGLLRLRDISHLVAILVRRGATLAAELRDPDSVELSLRFLNTFMRASLNARDQRSAYHLLNEYRLLAETLLGLGRHEPVVEIAERCKFYGQLAFRMNLPFLLETVAFDLSMLIEAAWDARAPCHDALLGIMLDVDRPPEGGGAQEASLRGVRKAQAKLAAFYLLRGADAPARRIFEDLRGEPASRLLLIRDELLAVREAEFWEVSDRGVNFEYLPPERRPALEAFFAWFEARAEVG